MKMKAVRCDSGIMGSQFKLHDGYSSFEEFESLDVIYGISGRLGFTNSKAAWKADPTIMTSVVPSDLRVVNPKAKVKVIRPLKLRLVIDVDYEVGDALNADVEDQLKRLADLAADAGMMSGELDATVSDWHASIEYR